MQIVQEWDLALDADKVLWGQGMDPERVRTRRPKLAEVAENVIRDGKPMLTPSAVYRRIPIVGVQHERLNLADGGKIQGALVAKHLAGAQELVVAVCTVGEKLTRYASEVFATDPVLSLALDGLASAAAEALGEELCRQFETLAVQEGVKCSIPLNPGMVGWPVNEGQAQIFSLLDTSQIGVELGPSGLMTPLKSLSFVMGLGQDLDSSGKSCDYCAMRDTCHYKEHYA